MPVRIPPALYSDILSENDLVVVILEHIDYLLKQEGKQVAVWLCCLFYLAIKRAVVEYENGIA